MTGAVMAMIKIIAATTPQNADIGARRAKYHKPRPIRFGIEIVALMSNESLDRARQ